MFLVAWVNPLKNSSPPMAANAFTALMAKILPSGLGMTKSNRCLTSSASLPSKLK
jgi:hypothetical protein